MQYYKDQEADDAKVESLRMKVLRMNHGKQVVVENANDAKKAVRIFRDREAIYYQNKEKAGAKEAVSNWNHLLKVFPKETMADTPLEFFLIDEDDNPNELKINVTNDQIH